MGRHSLRILAQAGLSGVFFAAKILRGELPRYRLPLPEFAANFYTRSAPLIRNTYICANFWLCCPFQDLIQDEDQRVLPGHRVPETLRDPR